MIDVTYTFPAGFLWGTATSAHQVEGGNDNNDWWRWEQAGGGHIFQDHVSGQADDWWNGRAEEDIARMADLNTNTHRMSVEWSRIEPKPGAFSDDAIARYREILTAMRQADIEPMVTLNHFTIPIWFDDLGGWTEDGSALLFKRYVEKVVADLGDLCSLWCTVNEPNVYAAHGFIKATSPPARQSLSDYFHVVYHLMEGHAAAYEALHAAQPRARVGLAKHLVDWEARHPWNPIDQLLRRLMDRGFNDVTLDLLETGRWHPLVGRRWVDPKISGTLDWVGLNYYQRYETGLNLRAPDMLGMAFSGRPGMEKGPEWWGDLWPYGMLLSLRRVHRRFSLPVYITENGVPDPTDEHRQHFIVDHLRRVWQAIAEGIDVRGYYFWSLIDNFEWAEGYNDNFRFGLYEVDFASQQRTKRRSAYMYAAIAGSNALSTQMARMYAPESLPILIPQEGPGETTVTYHRPG